MNMPDAIEARKIKIQGGKMYLPVAARVLWFRMVYPSGAIITEPVTIDMEAKRAIFRTVIKDPNGQELSSATKHEDARGFGDFIEKAETGSVGRALALAGFGTDDLGDDEIVEAPRAARQTTPIVAARQVDSAVVTQPAPPPPTIDELRQLVKEKLHSSLSSDEEDELIREFWRTVEASLSREVPPAVKSGWPKSTRALIDGYKIIEAIQ